VGGNVRKAKERKDPRLVHHVEAPLLPSFINVKCKQILILYLAILNYKNEFFIDRAGVREGWRQGQRERDREGEGERKGEKETEREGQREERKDARLIHHVEAPLSPIFINVPH